ncbi:MAG: hypothetical protein QXP50_01940 [Candidatus Methanomethylicia archaeon]
MIIMGIEIKEISLEQLISKFNINLNEIIAELEKLNVDVKDTRIFLEDYVPIRLQEIFSYINGKYNLDVIETMVLEGNLVIICVKRRVNGSKTILGLTATHNNHTNQGS